MPVRILIVDDHDVVRQGIRAILRARPDWDVVGEAVNGNDAIEQAKKYEPEIIIMDITMPEKSGIEATREITKLNLRSTILIFTMHEAKNLGETVQSAGARGYVLKSRAARDLIEAIETLVGGGQFFGSESERAEKRKDNPTQGIAFRAGLAHS
jgi:DNA-binding NarL/FixJ family response regulator